MDKVAKVVESKYLTGKDAAHDATKPMGTPTYRTPGPTVRLRGVEANTAYSKGKPQMKTPGTTAIEYGDPNEAPIPFDVYGDDE